MNGLQHDILTIGSASGADLASILDGYHFDYIAQRWERGRDHAHMIAHASENLDTVPLAYCGADLATCRKGSAEWSNLAADLLTEREVINVI